MIRHSLLLLLLTLVLTPAITADDAHPILALGAQAPDFCLPGIDGKPTA